MITITDRPDGPFRRAAGWLGHYSPLLSWLVVAVITADLTADSLAAWLLAVVTAVVMAIYLIGLIAETWCHRGLCEYCARSSPLDAGAAVARWTLALRWRHARRLRTAVVVPVCIVLIVTGLLRLRSPLVLDPVLIVPLLLLALDNLAGYQHRRLRPWCPFCRWGDGGPGEAVPVPDPDPALELV